MKQKKNEFGLQTAIFAAGTIASLLIFLGEADYFEYMQGMPLGQPGYFFRVQKVLERIAEELQYRGFFWGVFVPFFLPMVITFVLTVAVGKIQKNIAAGEKAHREAQKQTACQTVQNQAGTRAPRGTAAELKAFKDLLDSGAITQEEFDAQKKKLLGV